MDWADKTRWNPAWDHFDPVDMSEAERLHLVGECQFFKSKVASIKMVFV